MEHTYSNFNTVLLNQMYNCVYNDMIEIDDVHILTILCMYNDTKSKIEIVNKDCEADRV